MANVQNPSELYRLSEYFDPSTPAPGPMIVALGGVVDAGHIQQLLTNQLLESASPDLIATFDVDQLLDYRGRRPGMVFDTSKYTDYDDPQITLSRLIDLEGQPYYLLTGPEPDYQWERVVAAIRELADRVGVSLIVSAHGIPMGVPHTRPIGVTAHSVDPDLVAGRESPFGRVQVPGSLAALLEYRLGDQGIGTAGFSIHVPAYVSQMPFPDGALVALNAITEASGLTLKNDALLSAATVSQAEITRQVSENEEVQAVVAAMEKQYDSYVNGAEQPSLPASGPIEIPTAAQMDAELEQFLRGDSEG